MTFTLRRAAKNRMAFIRQGVSWWRLCPTSRNAPFPVLLSSGDANSVCTNVLFVTASLPWGRPSLSAMGMLGYFPCDGAGADEGGQRSFLTSKRRWAQRHHRYAPARAVCLSPNSSCLQNLQPAHRNLWSELISRPCEFLPSSSSCW